MHTFKLGDKVRHRGAKVETVIALQSDRWYTITTAGKSKTSVGDHLPGQAIRTNSSDISMAMGSLFASKESLQKKH